MPLPYAEPIGLPAPAWLLQFLLVLTFSLHLLAMTITVGGSLVAALAEVLARFQPAGSLNRRLASKLWSLLPIVTAFTISLGVAPLLFVQLIYGKFFYPASILTGWSWFSVVPLLIVGYGLLYVMSMSAPESRFRPWAAVGSVLAFLAVGGIYVSTMSLTTQPELWQGMYAQTQAGTHMNFDLTRALHVLTGALTIAGSVVALIGHLDADDRFHLYVRRLGLAVVTVGLALSMVVGLAFLNSLSEAARAAVSTPLLLGVGAVAAIGWLSVLMAEFKQRSPLLAGLGLAGLSVGAILLAVQRHLVRQALLAPNINTAADWKLQPQWDVFAIFAVLLVGTLGLIGYLTIRFFKETAQPAAGGHKSRKTA